MSITPSQHVPPAPAYVFHVLELFLLWPEECSTSCLHAHPRLSALPGKAPAAMLLYHGPSSTLSSTTCTTTLWLQPTSTWTESGVNSNMCVDVILFHQAATGFGGDRGKAQIPASDPAL